MLSHYQDRIPHAPQNAPSKPKINDHVLAFAVPFAIAVVLAIVIPLAAILPQRYIKPLPISVLMPFYVDPIQGSWDRLYDRNVSNVNTNVGMALTLTLASWNSTTPSSPSSSIPRTVPKK